MRDNLKRNSYLSGLNSTYIAEVYSEFLKNPTGVDKSWQDFFRDVGDDISSIIGDFGGASWSATQGNKIVGYISPEEVKAKQEAAKKAASSGAAQKTDGSTDSIRAMQLIRAYRATGHFHANLDPLGLEKQEWRPELDPAAYGFNENDYDRPINLDGVLGLQSATLRELLAILRQRFCTTVGYEFRHLDSDEQRSWLEKKVEHGAGEAFLSQEDKKQVLQKIIEVEGFEQFLHKKYPGTKRFSIEGGETTVSSMEEIITTSAKAGVEEIVVGMAHRGRLNVLTAVMGKPYSAMLSEFQGNLAHPDFLDIAGDVKYHLGTSSDRMIDGKKVHLTLNANPSHLEAVNPVVSGRVRAKQDQRKDAAREKVLGILIHGDAAFSGQGVVAETLSMADLEGYKTGGTVHIIINNQIGFTTTPENAHVTRYPTEVAKVIQAPIFHVNGDDPEAVTYVSRMAAEFRARFKKDVVIDIFCYRRYGHNEGDEPFFTQPVMYEKISNHLTPRDVYAEKLISDGVLTKDDFEARKKKWDDFLEKEKVAADNYKPNKADWLEGKWQGLKQSDKTSWNPETGVDIKKLKEIGLKISEKPTSVNIHNKVEKLLETRRKMVETGTGFDWAMGEALAFGSLLQEGHPVRLSGQDCIRGTFSHRHSGLFDQKSNEVFFPLNNMSEKQAKLEVINSNLSEFAVLGFEYGYTLAEPNALTLWEAQFGDFSNGCQVIIDQFISSSESKWLRMSGLVMLLPHGYEGQGPEHSSARLERYLQLCAEDNMQVANFTTPANYFHALRRQIKRNFRKPLVVMSPKSLLRHKLAQSKIEDMAKGTSFLPVIGETEKLEGDKVRKVIICSGKVYYDILEARIAKKQTDVAIVRLEQFYPFPSEELTKELKKYKNAEVVWCQEEPKNMGGWTFVDPFIEEVLAGVKTKSTRAKYVGRKAAASPAAGYAKVHAKEQKALVDEALS